jgi:hypothetical protein
MAVCIGSGAFGVDFLPIRVATEEARNANLLEAVSPRDPSGMFETCRRSRAGKLAFELVEDVRKGRVEDRSGQPIPRCAGEADLDNADWRLIVVEDKTANQEILVIGNAHASARCKAPAAAKWNVIGHEARHRVIASEHRPHTAIPPVS